MARTASYDHVAKTEHHYKHHSLSLRGASCGSVFTLNVLL